VIPLPRLGEATHSLFRILQPRALGFLQGFRCACLASALFEIGLPTRPVPFLSLLQAEVP
jgi:hypothetical protein